ncbi:MAG: multifunctional oxoglutarate decarboxylase/oxoglutarate dehydrogenase thiamine pyrophosphate-binding subunit/dihydrolipoyllysine-residue succinyltransferase subunit [Segniliparus sp.]|uniref:multifunctional oxoglutarate decarboxylase/oxoglutarate dehydrogenase thiamine pyrophosphate-binding subunit/dihydrolipoyllysine-residue succinyltransferase subunit n=1 Tax=Segniliparus sp. TaxID=2804064 RepID=UPI003F3D1350
MYHRFKENPNSVDPSWHEFLTDYHSTLESIAGSGDNGSRARAAAETAPPPPVQAEPPANGNGAQAPAPQQSAPAPAPAAPKLPVPPAPQASAPAAQAAAPSAPASDESVPLKGIAAAVAKNMTASLGVPTATSVRAIPAKAMIDNRIVINNHMNRTRGGKISFTHLIGYAVVQAVKKFPGMNRHFAEADGKPQLVTPAHINLGIAIDTVGKDGKRTLVVPAIKHCEEFGFGQFIAAYEDVVRRGREGKLGTEDYAGVTISLTNPGTIGTVHSVPRLMAGQGAIIGVGAMEYPAEFQGASEERISDLGVGKLITLTSTYDHRIIQGAESGDFLRTVHQLLISDEFYDELYAALRIPYEPIRWRSDIVEHGVDKSTRVLEIISAYRSRGHLMADTDPLLFNQQRRTGHPDLDVLNHNLTLWDLDRVFNVGGFQGKERMKLRDVLAVLRDSYCRHVGVEYSHILEPEQREWLQEQVEVRHQKPSVNLQKYILSKLNAAESFENFLHTKYIGQKRFSLEGAETVIPMMDAIIDRAAEHALDEVVIGMPHRGRLNVLANIVGKPYKLIFNEFEGNLDPSLYHGSGDVKYHLGAEGTYFQMFGENEIKVSLTANPSHLEAVDPVLAGIVRGKQEQVEGGGERFPIMALALHGDGAFAGQGVVAETLNMSALTGYNIGGTVHIVVNNQIAFTTSPDEGRSSVYCTDVAKTIGAPVFHVNGDDPEAAAWVAQLAVDYRERFHRDVVIDLVCYRQRGHNEGDDPSMTQPTMYDVIENKRSVRKSYTEALIGRGDITIKEADDALRDYQGQLERVFNEVKELERIPPAPSHSVEADQQLPLSLVTAVSKTVLEQVGDAFVDVPEGFTPHPKVFPVNQRRHDMSRAGNVDWATAELFAFGSLLLEGHGVRLSGQDCRRGTFSQRHALLIDRHNGDVFSPLAQLAAKAGSAAQFEVFDSPLSEYAVMGFEYGYSLANPTTLTLWEAQFGDFANGAQSIIDEYISSGEAKWGQRSDVVLLLPHGQEGQGPDHSSGRIERYLSLCAESSMTVAHPSTPASYFHLLRRHALDGIHRPLIVFTPKSMLRNKHAVSSVEDFTEGKFLSVLDDPTTATEAAAEKVRTVILTSGKLYWQLAERKAADHREDIAIVRIEQLYPEPFKRLRAALERYPNAKDFRWAQEEPANQGPWPHLGLALPELLPDLLPKLTRVSRRAMSAPSSGSAKVHEVEQQELLRQAFA